MIPPRLKAALERHATPITSEVERHEINRVLTELGVRQTCSMREIYTAFAACSIFCVRGSESELESDPDREPRPDLIEVVSYREDDSAILGKDPWETPIGAATEWVREMWGVPPGYLCLTTTDAVAYLYHCDSDAVFDLCEFEGQLLESGGKSPRFESFAKFIEWQLGVEAAS